MILHSTFSLVTVLLSIFMTSEASQACCYNAFAQPTTVGLGSSTVLFVNNGCLATADGFDSFGSISTFSYDTTSCAFAATSNTYANGFVPLFTSLAFLPNCNLLLAVDFNTSFMRIFNVANCQLTEITPAIPVATNPRSVAVSPDGTCVAVLSFSELQLYCVNTISCTLQLCDSLNFTGLNLSKLAFAPLSTGCNFLVLTTGGNSIIQVPFVPKTCTLGTPNIINIPGANSTFALSFSPNGNCLAVSDSVTNSLFMFGINSCNLTLTQTTSSGGAIPRDVAFSADSSCLAVANAGSDNVTIFSVNQDCTLGLSPQVLFAPNPFSVAFSPQPSNCNLLAVGSQIISPNSLSIFKSCAAPVLTLSKCCKKCITADGNVKYVITVTNTGTANATQVTVTDILPSCLKFKKGCGKNWHITGLCQTVTATLATLEPGNQASFEIIAHANCCPGQTVTNTASAVSNEITIPVEISCSSKVK